METLPAAMSMCSRLMLSAPVFSPSTLELWAAALVKVVFSFAAVIVSPAIFGVKVVALIIYFS
jgi:hypothetical protein